MVLSFKIKYVGVLGFPLGELLFAFQGESIVLRMTKTFQLIKSAIEYSIVLLSIIILSSVIPRQRLWRKISCLLIIYMSM